MGLKDTVCVMMEMPLFRNVDPKRLRAVAMMGETLTFRGGERLFEQGDDGDAAYIILEGSVDVLVPVDGHENKIAELGPKQIFGEMAVICDQPRTTSIVVHSDLKVLRLERSAFLSTLKEFPDISLELIKIMATRLRNTTQELAVARG